MPGSNIEVPVNCSALLIADVPSSMAADASNRDGGVSNAVGEGKACGEKEHCGRGLDHKCLIVLILEQNEGD